MKAAPFLLASLLLLQGAADPFWPRIEAMIAHRAYSLALHELEHADRPLPEKARLDYLRGVCLRWLKQDPKPALLAVPRTSPWFLPSRHELADTYRAEGKLSEAADTMDQVMAIEPQEAEIEHLADLYFMLGRYVKAAEWYEKLSSRHPSVLFSLAWCHARMKNYPKALVTWQEAINRLPNSPRSAEARISIANCYLQLDKVGKASEHFRMAKELDRAEFLAGEAAMADGNWERALAHYRQVKGRFCEPASFGHAFALWQQGKLEESRKRFEENLKRFPKGALLADTHYALGRILETQGLYESSHLAFNRALDAGKPEIREKALYRLCALAFGKGLFEETINWAKKLEEEFPQSEWLPETVWATGESALSLNDFALAIQCYDRLASIPDLGFLKGKGDEIHYRLGIARLRAGKYEAAMDSFEQCKGDLLEEALFWKTEALALSGKNAQTAYLAYLKRFPQGKYVAEAQYGLGWDYLGKRMLPEAAKQFRLAAEGLKDARLKNDALRRLGGILTQLGQWAEARKAFDRLESDDEEALFQRALCALRTNSLDAEGLFLTFLKTHPQSKQRLDAKTLLGQLRMKQGRYPEAAEVFEEITQQPLSLEETLEASFKLAACYANAGRPSAASEVYTRLLARNDLPESLRNEIKGLLIRTTVQSGELASARALAAAATASWAPEALDEIARKYWEQGNVEEAARTLSGMKRNPGQDLLLARCWTALGDATRSATLLRDLANKKGAFQEPALVELTKLHRDEQHLREALFSFQRLHRLFPGTSSVGIGMELARTAREKKEDEIAQDIYRSLVRSNEKSPVGRAAWFALGEMALAHRSYEEAAIAFRRAETASAPKSGLAAQARYWLGYTLVSSGRYEDAIAELDRLKQNQEAKTWLPLAWLKQGEAHERLMRFERAQSLYFQVLKYGEPSERSEAQRRIDWITKNVRGKR